MITIPVVFDDMDEEKWETLKGLTEEYSNEAIIDGKPTNTHKLKVEKPGLDNINKNAVKVFEEDGIDYVEYELIINPHKEADFSQYGETLTLTDNIKTLQEDVKLSIVEDSVNLYEFSGDIYKPRTDEEVEYKSFKINAKSQNEAELIFEVPNNQALVLTYQIKVERLGKDNNVYLGSIIINNEADLEGQTATNESRVSSVNSYGRMISLDELSFIKVDEFDYATRLKDAEFTSYVYESQGWKKIDEFISNEEGLFTIKIGRSDPETYSYKKDTLYKLIETKASPGYVNSEQTIYFMVIDKDPSDIVLPVEIDIEDVRIISNVLTPIYIENSPAIEIPVEKKWNDRGNKFGLRPLKVTINLLVNNSPALDNNKLAIKAELSELNNWKHIFKNLKKYDKDKNMINYRVFEDPVPGYTSVVSGDMETGFTITNIVEKPEDPYDTPSDNPGKPEDPEDPPTEPPIQPTNLEEEEDPERPDPDPTDIPKD